jgi:restriction endonuclease S subunit
LKYHFDIGLFERRCTKWIGQAAIQTENLLGLYIVLPPLNEQIIANEKIKKIEQAIEFSEIKLERSRMLQKSLINQIF